MTMDPNKNRVFPPIAPPKSTESAEPKIQPAQQDIHLEDIPQKTPSAASAQQMEDIQLPPMPATMPAKIIQSKENDPLKAMPQKTPFANTKQQTQTPLQSIPRVASTQPTQQQNNMSLQLMPTKKPISDLQTTPSIFPIHNKETGTTATEDKEPLALEDILDIRPFYVQDNKENPPTTDTIDEPKKDVLDTDLEEILKNPQLKRRIRTKPKFLDTIQQAREQIHKEQAANKIQALWKKHLLRLKLKATEQAKQQQQELQEKENTERQRILEEQENEQQLLQHMFKELPVTQTTTLTKEPKQEVPQQMPTTTAEPMPTKITPNTKISDLQTTPKTFPIHKAETETTATENQDPLALEDILDIRPFYVQDNKEKPPTTDAINEPKKDVLDTDLEEILKNPQLKRRIRTKPKFSNTIQQAREQIYKEQAANKIQALWKKHLLRLKLKATEQAKRQQQELQEKENTERQRILEEQENEQQLLQEMFHQLTVTQTTTLTKEPKQEVPQQIPTIPAEPIKALEEPSTQPTSLEIPELPEAQQNKTMPKIIDIQKQNRANRIKRRLAVLQTPPELPENSLATTEQVPKPIKINENDTTPIAAQIIQPPEESLIQSMQNLYDLFLVIEKQDQEEIIPISNKKAEETEDTHEEEEQAEEEQAEETEDTHEEEEQAEEEQSEEPEDTHEEEEEQFGPEQTKEIEETLEKLLYISDVTGSEDDEDEEDDEEQARSTKHSNSRFSTSKPTKSPFVSEDTRKPQENNLATDTSQDQKNTTQKYQPTSKRDSSTTKERLRQRQQDAMQKHAKRMKGEPTNNTKQAAQEHFAKQAKKYLDMTVFSSETEEECECNIEINIKTKMLEEKVLAELQKLQKKTRKNPERIKKLQALINFIKANISNFQDHNPIHTSLQEYLRYENFEEANALLDFIKESKNQELLQEYINIQCSCGAKFTALHFAAHSTKYPSFKENCTELLAEQQLTSLGYRNCYHKTPEEEYANTLPSVAYKTSYNLNLETRMLLALRKDIRTKIRKGATLAQKKIYIDLLENFEKNLASLKENTTSTTTLQNYFEHLTTASFSEKIATYKKIDMLLQIIQTRNSKLRRDYLSATDHYDNHMLHHSAIHIRDSNDLKKYNEYKESLNKFFSQTEKNNFFTQHKNAHKKTSDHLVALIARKIVSNYRKSKQRPEL